MLLGQVEGDRGREKSKYLVYPLFFLMLFYAIQDFRTSANTGIKSADRGAVHITLLAILAYLAICYFYTALSGKVSRSSTAGALWIIAVWIAVADLTVSADRWSMSVRLGLSVLWVLTYSFFCRYFKASKEAWKRVLPCMMIMFAFYGFSAFYASHRFQVLYGKIIALNLSYSVLVFLPWITMVKLAWKRRVAISVVCIVVIMSMKRGAIVVLPLMLSTAMMVDALVSRRGKLTIIKIASMTLMLFVAFLVADNWSGGYLSERFSPESLATGSGRVTLYASALKDISHRSFPQMMLGRGSGSTGEGSHNEWLEFLCSYGVVGLILYGGFLGTVVRRLFRLVRARSLYASSYSMVVVYLLTVGMFGQIYFAHSTLYCFAFLGAIDGLFQSRVVPPNFHKEA